MSKLEKYKIATLKKAAVIDDRKEFREMFSRYFNYEGFTVSTADSFRSGIKLIEKEFFHVAAVDLSLIGDRNRDGLKIIQKIYQELKEGTEAILLSAFGTMEIGAKAKEYGAFAIIEKKNVKLDEFGTMVNKAYQKAIEGLSHHNIGINFLAGQIERESIVVSTTNIIQLLSAGDFNYVDSFTRNLLRDLSPLLYKSTNSQAMIDKKKRLVKGLYWSKMVGKPILVEIGPPEVIQCEQDDFETKGSGKQEQRESIFRSLVNKKIAGLVFSLTQLNRDAFRSFQIT